MSDSCAGACCSVFPLNAAPALFANPSGFKDGPYLVDMLIPLTPFEAMMRSLRLGYGVLPWVGSDLHLFTCRHWDETTRLCTAYDTRPDMCRTYPYGVACERGCGWELEGEPLWAYLDHRETTAMWDAVSEVGRALEPARF